MFRFVAISTHNRLWEQIGRGWIAFPYWHNWEFDACSKEIVVAFVDVVAEMITWLNLRSGSESTAYFQNPPFGSSIFWKVKLNFVSSYEVSVFFCLFWDHWAAVLRAINTKTLSLQKIASERLLSRDAGMETKACDWVVISVPHIYITLSVAPTCRCRWCELVLAQ